MTDNPRLDDLRRRVQKDPASIAFAQLAEEYRRARLFTEAVEVCRAGLAVHPGYLSARVTLGRALVEVGELDAARLEFESVLAGAPENLSAIRGLGEIHQRGGNLQAALGQFERALSLAPNDPDLEETVGDLRRQVESSVRPVSDAGPAQPAGRSSQPSDAEQDRAVRTVSALEEFLAAIHAAGADRRA
jgi:tetratricopeptide (TPR) repeat protein